MKLRIFIILFCLAFSIKAQHTYYSSLNQNLLSVNPAFAGTNKQLRTQAIIGETGMPKYGGKNIQSYYAGFDCLGKKYSGFGLSFSNSNSGQVLRHTQVDFSYALHFTIKNKIKIVHAYQFSFFEYKYDRTKLSFGEQSINTSDVFAFVNSSEIVPSQYKRNVDFSSGLLIYGKRFYAGASILSITQPDEGLLGVSKRPITQIYQGKYRFLNPDKFNFDIYGFAKLQKIVWINHDGYHTKNIRESFVQYGTYLNYKAFSIHIAHRVNEVSEYDAFIAGVAINTYGFKIGYNNKCNYGSHLSNYFFNEFYLQYSFGRNKKEDSESKGIKLID